MDQWEYKTVELYRGTMARQPGGPAIAVRAIAEMESQFDSLGHDGWEAVGPIVMGVTFEHAPINSQNYSLLLFKRRL